MTVALEPALPPLGQSQAPLPTRKPPHVGDVRGLCVPGTGAHLD